MLINPVHLSRSLIKQMHECAFIHLQFSDQCKNIAEWCELHKTINQKHIENNKTHNCNVFVFLNIWEEIWYTFTKNPEYLYIKKQYKSLFSDEHFALSYDSKIEVKNFEDGGYYYQFLHRYTSIVTYCKSLGNNSIYVHELESNKIYVNFFPANKFASVEALVVFAQNENNLSYFLLNCITHKSWIPILLELKIKHLVIDNNE